MLSPFAPHTAEELWEMLGHRDGLTTATLAGVRRRRREGRRNRHARAGQRQGAEPPDRRRPRRRRQSSSGSRWPTRPSWRTLRGKTVKKVVVAKGRLVSVVVSIERLV